MRGCRGYQPVYLGQLDPKKLLAPITTRNMLNEAGELQPVNAQLFSIQLSRVTPVVSGWKSGQEVGLERAIPGFVFFCTRTSPTPHLDVPTTQVHVAPIGLVTPKIVVVAAVGIVNFPAD